jgi:CBS domain-containing protein
MQAVISHEQLGGLWSTAVASSGSGGGAFMFVAASAADSSSEVAAAFAEMAAARVSNAAWLLDLDLFANRQFRRLSGAEAGLQGPFDMAFGQEPFWKITPRPRGPDQARAALVGYRVPDTRLFVSYFDRSMLEGDQSVKVTPAASYWTAVRNRVDMTIVDAPSLDRSRVGLALAQDMDGVVLVVNGERADPSVTAEIRDEIAARNGRCLGVVVTHDVRRARAGASGGLFGRNRPPMAANR